MSLRYSVRLDIWYESIQDRHGKIDEIKCGKIKPTKKQALSKFKKKMKEKLPEGESWVVDIVTYEWNDEYNEISQLYDIERVN